MEEIKVRAWGRGEDYRRRRRDAAPPMRRRNPEEKKGQVEEIKMREDKGDRAEIERYGNVGRIMPVHKANNGDYR